MAIVRRSQNTVSGSGVNVGGTFSLTPLSGSFLVAVIATYREIGVNGITQTGVTWTSAGDFTSGATGPTSTRSTIFIAYPDVVVPVSTAFTINLSGTSDVAAVVAEYTGFAEDDFADLSKSGGGTGSPATLASGIESKSDRQLFIAGFTKADASNKFEEPQNGYAIATQTSGPSSQYAVLLEKIVTSTGLQSTGISFSGGSIAWAGVAVTFKEFEGDFALEDSITDGLIDQLIVEKFPVELFDAIIIDQKLDIEIAFSRGPNDTVGLVDQIETAVELSRAAGDSVATADQIAIAVEVGLESSDAVSVSDGGQPTILFVGGADGHPTGEPIPIRVERDGVVAKSSIEIEVKYGAGSYQHVFDNEVFVVPAGGDSVITETIYGWDLSVAPLGFWPRNTLIGVRVTADSFVTPFEYSFTTADESPLVRGVTFIQAAVGRTP